eukprot:g14880.t1
MTGGIGFLIQFVEWYEKRIHQMQAKCCMGHEAEVDQVTPVEDQQGSRAEGTSEADDQKEVMPRTAEASFTPIREEKVKAERLAAAQVKAMRLQVDDAAAESMELQRALEQEAKDAKAQFDKALREQAFNCEPGDEEDGKKTKGQRKGKGKMNLSPFAKKEVKRRKKLEEGIMKEAAREDPQIQGILMQHMKNVERMTAEEDVKEYLISNLKDFDLNKEFRLNEYWKRPAVGVKVISLGDGSVSKAPEVAYFGKDQCYKLGLKIQDLQIYLTKQTEKANLALHSLEQPAVSAADDLLLGEEHLSERIERVQTQGEQRSNRMRRHTLETSVHLGVQLDNIMKCCKEQMMHVHRRAEGAVQAGRDTRHLHHVSGELREDQGALLGLGQVAARSFDPDVYLPMPKPFGLHARNVEEVHEQLKNMVKEPRSAPWPERAWPERGS